MAVLCLTATMVMITFIYMKRRLFQELEENRKVLVFGHRGYSEKFPENTMVSFLECAKDPRVDGIELDVHVCKSGEVVVAHDFSLKRTAGLDREITDLTYEELQGIDVGSFKDPSFSDCRVPLLEEVFKTFGSRFYYDIELKVKANKVNIELSRKVYDLIVRYGLEERVMVSSFNPFALRLFRTTSSSFLETADIFTKDPVIPKILWRGKGRLVSLSSYLKPGLETLDDDLMKKYSKVPIIAWTVNEKEDVQRLLKYNEGERMRVFGMIGNDPAKIFEEIKRCRESN